MINNGTMQKGDLEEQNLDLGFLNLDLGFDMVLETMVGNGLRPRLVPDSLYPSGGQILNLILAPTGNADPWTRP